MFEEDRFPVVDKALLDKLEELFPERCPAIDLADRKIWWDAGARSVVRFLRRHYDEQNQNVLENSIVHGT